MKKLSALLLALVSLVHLPVMSGVITWTSPPTLISTVSVDASDPQTVIDTGGNVTAVWIESGVVMTSSLPFNGSWSAAASLSGSSASEPKLGIDVDGNVVALWLESGVVTSKNLPFGGSWSSATSVSSATATAAQLAVDATGNAVAAWVRGGYIESAKQLTGGSWSSVSVLSSNGADSVPQVAIGANGRVVAAWHQLMSGTSHMITAATALISGSWNTAVNVIPVAAAFVHHNPQLAVDDNGNATILWFRYQMSGPDFTNVILITSSLTNGASTWALPIILSDPFQRNPTDLSLRVRIDGSGNVVAIWNPSTNGSVFNVDAAVKPATGNWTGFGHLISLNEYAKQTDLAADSIGDALAVYMGFDGGDVKIFSSESDLGGTVFGAWTPPSVISDGSDNGFPRAAQSLLDDTVNASAVWIHNDGFNNRIAATVGAKTLLGAPSNVVISQDPTDFGAFVDYVNTISWDASADPNTAGYIIYRNGLVMGETSSGTLQIVDHNRGQNEAVTYGVAAFDNNFFQSRIVTASFP